MWAPIAPGEQKLHLTSLHFSSHTDILQELRRPFVIALSSPLPLHEPFLLPLFGLQDTAAVSINAVKKCLMLSAEQVASVTLYTRSILRAALNKPLDTDTDDVVFLFLPLCQNSRAPTKKGIRPEDIAWSEVNETLGGLCRPFALDNLAEDIGDAMTTYRSEFGARFHINGIETDAEDAHLQLTTAPSTASCLDPGLKAGRESSVTLVKASNCLRYSVSASIYRAAQCLPSILTILEDLHAAAELNEQCFKGSLAVLQVMQALSSPSALRPWDYQRLELLGDVLLKVMVSTALFITQPTARESTLNAERSSIVNNKRLAESVATAGLHKYMRLSPLRIKSFVPAGFVLAGSMTRPEPEPAQKRLADVAEALIGAASDGGASIEKAFGTAVLVGVRLPFESWSLLVSNSPKRMTDPPAPGVAALGHTFTDPSLLTMATSMAPSASLTRQRLEFVGDAALDYLTVTHLLHAFPDATEGDISLMKEASVNNNTLAALCVEIDLHGKLKSMQKSVCTQVQTFVNDLQDAKQSTVAPYWLGLSSPKCLADTVEAVLGAILVDAAFDLTTPRAVFHNVFLPFFEAKSVFTQTRKASGKKRKFQ